MSRTDRLITAVNQPLDAATGFEGIVLVLVGNETERTVPVEYEVGLGRTRTVKRQESRDEPICVVVLTVRPFRQARPEWACSVTGSGSINR